MKRKLLSFLLAVAMLCGLCTNVFAIAVTNDGTLVPTMTDTYIFKNTKNSQFGVVLICDMPQETITSATLRLYDSSDNQIKEAVYTTGQWVTGGERAFHSFTGLTENAQYRAEIILSDGTNSGTTTISDIVAGKRPIFDGYGLGPFKAEEYNDNSDGRIALSSTHVDTNVKYSGNSSVRYNSYGVFNTTELADLSGGSRTPVSRDDWWTRIFYLNGINSSLGFEANGYVEYSFAFKLGMSQGAYALSQLVDVGSYSGISEVAGTESITELEDGWYRYKVVLHPTSTSITAKVIVKNIIDTVIWFDDFNMKKINDFNTETNEYSSVGNNILYGSDFEIDVQDLAMYEEKVLTWSLGEGWFAGLNIYKDGVLIDTISSEDVRGVTATSYTIPNDKWDINSTYTVKAIPGSGGGHSSQNPSGTKESAGVSVTGISDVVAENYNGAKPTDLIALGYNNGINAVWNMPSTSNVLQMKAELIDRDGITVQKKMVYDADGINAFAVFPLEANDTNKYTVKVTIIYSDKSAGVETFEGVTEEPPSSNIFGMYFGKWMINTTAGQSTLKPVWNAYYDTTNYKTGTGSLYFDYRGWAYLDGSAFGNGSAPGNTYVRLEDSCAVEKNSYYEITVVSKDPVRSYYNNPSAATFGTKGGSSMNINVGANTEYVEILNDNSEAVYSVSQTDENGWKTTKAVWSSGNNETFRGGLMFEWSSLRHCWLDSYTVKKVEYNSAAKTYEVEGPNLFVSGDMSFDVTNAYMDDDGTVYWTNSENINRVNVYDAQTNELVDSVDATSQHYSVMTEIGKTYILKALTMRDSTRVSTVETEGVTVTPCPNFEVGEISASKIGTSVQASVRVKNNRLPEFSACLIIAEYDPDGRFVNSVIDSTELDPGAQAETLTAIMTVGETSTVKAFVWRNLDTVAPLKPEVLIQ